jgi:CubicO group peptidase (beta-lactamase class C family)
MKALSVIVAGLTVAAVAAGTVAGVTNLASLGRSAAGTHDVSNAAGVKRLDGTTITPAEIDATVTRLMTAGNVPGAGIAILVDGKIAYLKAYGSRDKQQNLPLTTASVMSGASFTKVAFAYLVMQLVEQGSLSLDKPVHEYLPKPLSEYENYRALAEDARFKKITARMLLSHTSGLPNWRWFTDDEKLRIYFEPGSRFAYSGEGIELLQLVVESIKKKGLQELMEEQVFRLLGMNRRSMVWEPRFADDFANGYDEQENSLRPATAQTRRRCRITADDGERFRKVCAASDVRGRIAARDPRVDAEPAGADFFAAPIPSLGDGDDPPERRDSIELWFGLGAVLDAVRESRLQRRP